MLMGSGSGPVGRGRTDRRPLLRDGADGRTRRGEGSADCCRASPSANVERAWGGPIDVSSDQLPFFGTVPGTRIHYGAGYSGNGVGPSWLGGQILASLVLGSDDEWSRLPLSGGSRRGCHPEPIGYVGGAAVRRAILAVEAADEAGRRAGPLARGVAALPRLLGLRLGTR